jgi:hypothetical protein
VGEVLLERLLLEERLGLDLGEFELDEFVVLGQAAEAGEDAARFGFAVVVDQPARGEGHEDHADTEEHGGSKL